MKYLATLLADESAATAIEYGLALALIALGIISAAQGLGHQLDSTFSEASSRFGTP